MVPSILNDSTAFWLDFEGSVFPETWKIEQKLSLEIPCFFSSGKKCPGPVFLDFGVHFGVSFGALGSSFSQLLEFFFKGWFWSDFEDAFWRGRRKGRGPWNLNFEGFGTLA